MLPSSLAYCRIGERSSHTWFVLAELLGLANVKNDDGSWTEYGSLIGVPVAVGACGFSPTKGNDDVRTPTQTVELPAGIDTTSASIIQGTVFADNGRVAGAFVRLLDGSGEFTAEVVASDPGYYRFFAAPGDLDRPGAVPGRERRGADHLADRHPPAGCAGLTELHP